MVLQSMAYLQPSPRATHLVNLRKPWLGSCLINQTLVCCADAKLL